MGKRWGKSGCVGYFTLNFIPFTGHFTLPVFQPRTPPFLHQHATDPRTYATYDRVTL